MPVHVWAATLPISLQEQVDSMLSHGDPSQALAKLLEFEIELTGDPEYDYMLGIVALEAKQYSLAQHAFERVVLVQPSHAGAWIDLAITNIHLGDQGTADDIIKHIETNFDPPENLKAQLNLIKGKSKGRLKVTSFVVRNWDVDVLVQRGGVSNANSGLSQTVFNLTPVGQPPIPVEIAKSHQPQSDQAYQIQIGGKVSIEHGKEAVSDLVIGVRGRFYDNQSDNDFSDAALGWNFVRAITQNSAIYLSPTVRYLEYGGEKMGDFFGIKGGVWNKWNICQLGLQSEWERRGYTTKGNSPANIPWIGAAIACAGNGDSVYVSMRYGIDTPDDQRPGGKVHRSEAALSYRMQPTKLINLDVQMFLADYRDSERYSPLLENNAKRYIHHIGERLLIEWQLPWQAENHWSVSAEVEKTRDISNLATSKMENTQLLIGMRYRFSSENK